MRISVVIPTYNRGAKLAETVRRVLSSDAGGLDEIEVLVIDDGSPAPARPIVESLSVAPPFALRCLRQENAGPAAARNNGFRAARGEVVLFVDDDILVPPDLIVKHVDAHRRKPGSVICGRCPLVEPALLTPLFRFINSLGNDVGEHSPEEFLQVDVLASGQVSVEHTMFDVASGVYRDDLATPAAEEFELSLRLRERGIPIYVATRIVALHDHPVSLESICRQQYKHAVGCAEAYVKYPATKTIRGLAEMVRANLGNGSSAPAMKMAAKRLLAGEASRSALVGAVRIAERLAPSAPLLSPLYRTVIGLHLFAGIADGMKKYSRNGAAPSC